MFFVANGRVGPGCLRSTVWSGSGSIDYGRAAWTQWCWSSQPPSSNGTVRLPPVLALALAIRTAVTGSRGSRFDSADERRQPALWGARRIHGELLRLGIEISQATVAKYMGRGRGTPSPTWRSFLRNQAAGIAAIDMFVVASASFRLLYVMIILAHDRRKIVRFDVTRYPTAGWPARQVTDAFPWDTAPRYLLRDNDASYGQDFRKQVDAMGITEVVSAARSPWQNAYVERVIGSIRRECLDHIVIFNERHLRRVLSSYADYYHRSRTHLSLDKDCPDPRPVMPHRSGRVVAFPQVNGLHHRYERLTA
jgi:putative transposase